MEAFETYRRYLFSLAYRMLGSAMDAEDLVQETYLRYQAAKPETIHSLQAYLTTILTRLCLDHLQSTLVAGEPQNWSKVSFDRSEQSAKAWEKAMHGCEETACV